MATPSFFIHDRANIAHLSVGARQVPGLLYALTLGPYDVDSIDQVAAIIPEKMTLISVDAVVKANGGASAALQVRRCQGTEAAASGDALLSATINLDTIVPETVTAGALVTTGVVEFAVGDRVGLDFTGTLTALADLILLLKFTISKP